MKNWCFQCSKQFQLLSAISFAFKYKDDNNVKIDLYTSSLLMDYNSVVEKLLFSGLFDNVYVFDVPEFKYKGHFRRLYKYFIRFRAIAFPSLHIQRITRENINPKKKYYDAIFTESLNHISVPIILSSDCPTYMLDDGTGSHIGSGFYLNYSKIEWNLIKLLYKHRIKSKTALSPDTLYLHNSKVSALSWPMHLYDIPYYFDNYEFIDLLKYIFNYDGADYYKEYRMIYLDQTNFCNISDDEYHNTTAELLSEFDKKMLLRPHPVEFSYYKEYFDVKNVTVDYKYNLWELICSDYINDDSVLISGFSSAMCIPKILYNMEPTLVFVYPVFEKHFSKSVLKTIQDVYEMMYNSYSDKSKIKLICSKNDLNSIMF